LSQLVAPEPSERFEARREVAKGNTTWLPAILERFERIADTTNKPALKSLLEQVRDHAREQLKRAVEGEGGSGPVVTPDYLEMLVTHPDRSSPHLGPLTHVVALSRMLENIASLPAARGVVSVYVRFGEFLRVDTQLALARMKDAAVAALIEATAHPVPRIATWAEKQLEDMGKSVPSDAVQALDPSLRADILRAYGKTGRLDTARLLISYAQSERAVVRLAARQAVALLGGAGLWQLRDAYEKAVGERAAKEWPWDRVARELFAKFDRQRLADIYRLFNHGLQAKERGDLESARKAFDQILAADPLFENGALMAPVYLAFAEGRADVDPEAAQLALRRAERLDPNGPQQARALSLRHTLEAKALLDRGLVDEVLLSRARELDPSNRRAQALLDTLDSESDRGQTTWRRYLAAAVIASLALVGLLVMALRQRQATKAGADSP
jgi:tetratricopeptide (TPR) repeat protein